MPELPDVEVLKRYFESTSLYQDIDSVDVNAEMILEDIGASELENSLVGNAFQNTSRHGKYLFLDLTSDYWLSMHFGMTGNLKYYRNDTDQPEYTKLVIHFKNEYYLALIMPRKLGKVSLLENPKDLIKNKRLGPDALSTGLNFEHFSELFADNRSMVKSALMDQQKIAGIGNVYSDEILYQAGIYPRRQFNKLSEKELRNLYDTMRDVLQTAIDFQAKPDKFPDGYLTTHRSEGENCPKCAGKVERIEVSGRAGYYCPECQV